MSGLWDRFQEAARTMVPTRFLRQEAEAPSYDTLIAVELEGWARLTECTEYFLPWLDRQIEAAESQELQNLDSHSRQSFWMGRAAQLKDLRRQFHTWSGTSLTRTPAIKE